MAAEADGPPANDGAKKKPVKAAKATKKQAAKTKAKKK